MQVRGASGLLYRRQKVSAALLGALLLRNRLNFASIQRDEVSVYIWFLDLGKRPRRTAGLGRGRRRLGQQPLRFSQNFFNVRLEWPTPMKPIQFALFTQASKELVSVGIEDGATNLVSALMALRRRFEIIHKELFSSNQMGTVHTAQGALDIYEEGCVIVQQHCGFKTAFSRRYAEANYIGACVLASAAFQKALQQNQAADLWSMFHSENMEFILTTNFESLFVNVSSFNQQAQDSFKAAARGPVVLAISAAGTQLRGLALLPGVEQRDFGKDPRQFALEINALLSAVASGAQKVCVPSLQPAAFLEVKKTEHTIFLLVPNSEFVQQQTQETPGAQLLIQSQFQALCGDEPIKQVYVINTKLHQLKKMDPNAPFELEALLALKFCTEDFFAPKSQFTFTVINQLLLAEAGDVKILAQLSASTQLRNEAEFQKRCSALLVSALWASVL